MKVYVLKRIYESSFHREEEIFGVFSSKEKVEKTKNSFDWSKIGSFAEIEEFELDFPDNRFGFIKKK